MTLKSFLFAGLVSSFWIVNSAAQSDSIPNQVIDSIVVKAYNFSNSEIQNLGDVHNLFILAGKKTETIRVANLDANLSEKTGRQIFAKIPSAFIYDMDGSGNQLNVATRGLDPHRSWEFNIRQNSVMTNSDIYGYPASHYSGAMESIERIEIVRGTAALQYGAEFGGMINYVTKSGDTTKKISYEGNHSLGSYGLFSSYNALSGKVGKFKYYAYYQKRISNGYRDNSRSNADAAFVSLTYQANAQLSIKAELAHSRYTYQIPGALTDSMFYLNPQMATRSRNYFNPNMYIPSIALNWKISNKTHLNMTSSAVLGSRNSVQFIGFANTPDTINAATLHYKSRQVDIDHFNSYTTEIKLQHSYKIAKLANTVIVGSRYIHNDMHRQQLGKGTTGTDFDLTIDSTGFGRDLHYKTQNIAVFVENLTHLTPKLSISLGARVEAGNTKMSGIIKYLAPENIPLQIKRFFTVLGASAQYKLNKTNNLYVGISQSYRPVILADVIPATVLDRTNPNLKDASGYNLEIGARGNWKSRLFYDVSLFQLRYNNRLGSLSLVDNNGQTYIYKTNIGNSLTNGIECYLEAVAFVNNTTKLSFFTATSFMDAHYLKGSVLVNGVNTDIKGNYLETVPQWISRNGLQFGYRIFNFSAQYSYVAKSYSDAFNTIKPSADGTKGIVPAYGIWDASLSVRLPKHYAFRLDINNLTNAHYFTKRPNGYPGAGVWSSNGITVQGTLSLKF